MAECSSCGAKLASHQSRCPTCGKTTPLYHRQRRCLHCGTPVAEQAQVCMMCHKPVDSLPLDRSIFSGSWQGITIGVAIIVLIVMTVLGYRNNGAVTAQAGLSPTPSTIPTRTATLTTTPTATGTPTITPTPTPPPTATPIIHIIESGQTLGLIAPIYGIEAEAIAALNGIDLTTTLSVGQELAIPGDATPPPENTPLPDLMVYVIKEGDLISSIAFQYGTTIESIEAVNPQTNLDWVYPGQEIVVPLSTPTPTGTPTPLPTPTSTPQPLYPAPNLLTPTNGEVIDAETVLFNWTSTILLAEDEFYVVEIAWLNDETTEHWVKSNSLRLIKADRPANGMTSWQVVIKEQTSTIDGQSAGNVLSPVGEPRLFEWR